MEIKPTASGIVFPDFILARVGRVCNEGKFNGLLCQSGAEGCKAFLTPAKPLRTPSSKGLWAGEWEPGHSPDDYPAPCELLGMRGHEVPTSQLASSRIHSRGHSCVRVCVFGVTMASSCQADSPPNPCIKPSCCASGRHVA